MTKNFMDGRVLRIFSSVSQSSYLQVEMESGEGFLPGKRQPIAVANTSSVQKDQHRAWLTQHRPLNTCYFDSSFTDSPKSHSQLDVWTDERPNPRSCQQKGVCLDRTPGIRRQENDPQNSHIFKMLSIDQERKRYKYFVIQFFGN